MLEKQTVYEFVNFRLDVHKQRLFCGEEVVSLPPKAIELLVLLVENQGVILEKEEIISTLWSDTIVEESNLTQTIYLLRKALGKTPEGESFINTFPKRGYKFIPPVQETTIPTHIVRYTKSKQEKIYIEREEKETFETRTSVLPNELKETSIPANISLKDKIIQNKFLVISLLAVLGVGLLALGYSLSGDTVSDIKSVKSVAVIPFNVIGAEDKEGYLSLGLADTLITRLGKTEKIKIFPTEQVQRNLKSAKDPLELGKRLGAETILTGNLQQFENRVRFNVQLIRVSDGKILWSNQFDEKSNDFFELQDSLTRRVTDVLTLELSEKEQKLVSTNPTDNSEALKLYWQGRYYWNKRTKEMIQKGIEKFEEAVKLDPKFAEAYAGLADSYALTASGLPPKERFPKAKAAAYKALELNKNLAEVHASLAIVTYKSEWDWAKAEKFFKRAIELNDSYPTAHHWYGEFLVMLGRFDEGLKALRFAEQLDPFSIAIKTDIAEGLYRAKRFKEARAQIEKVLEYDPNHIQAFRILRNISIQESSKNPDVVKFDKQILGLYKVSPEEIVQLQNLYRNEGWENYWEKRLTDITNSLTNRYSLEKILILILLEKYDEAIDEIEQKSKKMDITPLTLKIDPLFEPLKSDSRFKKLID